MIKGAAALILIVAGFTLLPGCGGGSDESADTAAPPAAAPSTETSTGPAKPAGKPGATVEVGKTNFGQILVDEKNVPLYLFTKDGNGPSKCYGECAVEWPPLLTKGEPVAGAGAKQSLLGTTKRSDGKVQVTYKGQPVYYWYKDAPGDVRCQAVDEFGGLWYILDGAGETITSSTPVS